MSKRKNDITHNTTATEVEETTGRAQFFIDQIVVEKNRTTMVVNASKDGCNQIVFDYTERADLKGLLLGIFEGGKPFDFFIVEKLGKGLCKINGIRRMFGLASSAADGQP